MEICKKPLTVPLGNVLYWKQKGVDLMKIKEACERTNLTKKTIRFYEAEGLFTSDKTYRGGKEYHDYTEENIQQLLRIATLRRARFTVDEIRRMHREPAETAEIFRGYRQRLLEEKRNLDEIVKVAMEIDEETLSGSDDLISQMETVASSMPLPVVDIHPRFRYIDELEKIITPRKKRNLTDEEKKQRDIAAINAAMYAGFSVQNSPGNNSATGGKGGGFDIPNAQKIAAYNLLKTFDDD